MKALSLRWLGLVGALALGLPCAEAAADQVVVFDQTYTHAPDLPDSHFRMPPAPEAPENWVSPVDWSAGSAWVHLEVMTKPTEQETKFQVCFEATPTYGCTYQSPTYTEAGVYEWETPFTGFWSPPGTAVDWTQGVNQIACILKDTMNGKPSADNVGDEIAALYMPTDVRIVVTLVEAGSVYEPPEPLDAGTGTGTGEDGGGDSTGDGGDGAGSTTGGEGGGDSTSGGAGEGEGESDDGALPGEDDGAPPPASGSDGAPTSGTAGDGTGEDGGGAADEGGGCDVAARRRGAPMGWLALGMLGVALALPRRR